MIECTPLSNLTEVKLIRPRRHADDRGFFAETYNAQAFAKAGIADVFVQDNQSVSAKKGTVRGLHLQVLPEAQAKLVRCGRGRILDVAVDLRPGSATFGQYATAELTNAGGEQLYVPVGFAHGFCTLEDDCEVIYKTTTHYSPACERSVFWADPELNIPWPVEPDEAILSKRDAASPPLREFAQTELASPS